MPEGDTVWRTAGLLRDALVGAPLTVCDIRVPRYATVDLTPAPVDEVVSHGKHLLIRIGDRTVHTHLKMEGVWQVYRPGSRWRRPVWQARILLGTERHLAVGFELGAVEVLAREQEHLAVGHLGPDPLGPDWDPVLAAANLAAAPDRPVGLALLDQRVMAGIGNEYRSEVCFLRGVHPATPVSAAGDPLAWAGLAHRLLDANRDRVVRVTTGDRRRGRTTWVYGRAGRPCLRCGTLVESGALGDGTTDVTRQIFWCPGCQPFRPSS
ncbi:Fpg/Nei family DNA glycosylase [Rhodococcus spelaei]|uniref:DNA-(apurinic or apyrimidinic site) lyase n=1 Tax=Rhodococcus spelaei TaxID=2546320 RepID=A0A541B143_9NOCA|nr:DNA-formamidopyrimidine glycosylase family protein [Rhodococcus spelaei]TQF66011.1 Fpg/Nei family DNA glycosylase [Rhodococcus spelaei]